MSDFFNRLPDFIGNHPFLSFGFVGVAIALVVNEVARLTRGYTALTPAGLTQLVNRDNALLFDVSSIQDYEKGHIPGARHVALSQFDPESKELAKVRELPVAVVCRSGQTSGVAAKRLVKAGFTQVYALDGGVRAWTEAQLPLAKGRATG
ncbi:MAG: rhodanese-like domain-containing protein [Xanthomonadales bacterium]|nr:rhodanese-like domain-containing protein [Xanthomonadales bacterium]